jgi:F-type H+-transporting ATPase subunit a
LTGTWLALLLAGQEAAHEVAGAAAEHAPDAGAAHGEAHDPAQVLMHHVLDQPFFGLPSKHMAFFVIAAALVILLARLAVRSYDARRRPSGLGSVVETFVLFIRDDIAESNIGHDGRKYVPLLCSFFFFILVAALLGLLPFSATSTGNIAVTRMKKKKLHSSGTYLRPS